MKCWEIFVQNMDMFFYGIRVTLLYAIVGTIVGFLIGLILGGIRGLEINESDSALVKGLKRAGHLITGCYVWVFRGTPMMVQAMFFYYFLKDLIGWNMATAGMFIISINTGAYMAEIIRSGLQSVDKGQTEAAKSIGMSTAQTLRYIIFPQAIRNAFPYIGNQLIVNIKDSCMLNVLSVTDLFFQSQSIAGSNLLFMETFFVTAILYLILTTVATFILNQIEKRLNMDSSYHDYCA